MTDIKFENKYIQELEKMEEEILKALKYKPKKIQSEDPLILYHGTSLTNFQKIKKQGIKPRGNKKSNWQGIGLSRPDLVYLTNCYAIYYAMAANKNKKTNIKNPGIILKIQVDPKKIKLYLDEEFIYHILKYNQADNKQMAEELYQTINPKNLNKLIKNSFYKLPTWQDSLNYMGTVSCDYIPKENIISYAEISVKDSLFCDPTINPLNYKIMAGEYIRQLEKLKYIKL